MMPKMIATKLTEVLEKIFADLNENICAAATRNCHNADLTTALNEVSSAISMMDIPWLVREALEMPHDNAETIDALAIPTSK